MKQYRANILQGLLYLNHLFIHVQLHVMNHCIYVAFSRHRVMQPLSLYFPFFLAKLLHPIISFMISLLQENFICSKCKKIMLRMMRRKEHNRRQIVQRKRKVKKFILCFSCVSIL